MAAAVLPVSTARPPAAHLCKGVDAAIQAVALWSPQVQLVALGAVNQLGQRGRQQRLVRNLERLAWEQWVGLSNGAGKPCMFGGRRCLAAGPLAAAWTASGKACSRGWWAACGGSAPWHEPPTSSSAPPAAACPTPAPPAAAAPRCTASWPAQPGCAPQCEPCPAQQRRGVEGGREGSGITSLAACGCSCFHSHLGSAAACSRGPHRGTLVESYAQGRPLRLPSPGIGRRPRRGAP